MIGSLTLEQARAITGGVRRGADVSFNAVSTDTRSLQQGELFVALKGATFDGNAFVASAQQGGACAALLGAEVATALPTLHVADTCSALGQLAHANRCQSHATVIGLTGSQGKTSVKEMTTAILAQAGAVHATRGNLNNAIGVPLTLLQITAQHRFAVIEMGANAPGEIGYLTRLVEPDLALITNIAPTHLEGFGSLSGVAAAKAELWQGLRGDGRAIVNLDDMNIPRQVRVQSGQKLVGISACGQSHAVYGVDAIEDQGLEGSQFSVWTPRGKARLHLALPGRHNVANALAALALAMEAGATLAQVERGLADLRGVQGRLMVQAGRGGATVIDDSYNASPASFKAAIDLLKALPGTRIVVAGDMGELGTQQQAAHEQLGAYAQDAGIDLFMGTGELTRLAVRAFGTKGLFAPDWQALAAAVLPFLAPEVTVLVKGSRSAKMERVVKQLLSEGA
ncbi:MAG: UDP-N-acetylmuramoyl-tripeptide--D-alanyl-D-alanine ligase [Pseudomonadales bacterium]|jgi:UDP-N-acetylmuramoyl-tripeptide--D-alanyl-D-alanine ligase|nr:UDP-N-acetylmuramoyl-tripeptide--D-alanyl-D-alanine ligase [Pseudomonadales bacterium]